MMLSVSGPGVNAETEVCPRGHLHRLPPQSSSASRRTAGASGHDDLIGSLNNFAAAGFIHDAAAKLEGAANSLRAPTFFCCSATWRARSLTVPDAAPRAIFASSAADEACCFH